jgi:hypothetical protein
MAHSFEGSYLVYDYGEMDNDAEARYLVVFLVEKNRLKPVWNPVIIYEPVDAPDDLNLQCIRYLKKNSIDTLVSVHDEICYGIDPLKTIYFGEGERYWFEYRPLCFDDEFAEDLSRHGFKIKYLIDGKYEHRTSPLNSFKLT